MQPDDIRNVLDAVRRKAIDARGGGRPVQSGGDDEPIAWTDPLTGRSLSDTDHMPCHELAIARFRIGQFAVTNAEWACFIAAGGYDDERWWDTADAMRWRRGQLINDARKYNNRWWRRRFKADPTLLEAMVADGSFANLGESVFTYRTMSMRAPAE